jgi:hypothetical protein
MISTGDKLPARETRFPVVDGKSIRVTIKRCGDMSAEELDAQLLDISTGGVKLTVTSCPAVQEAVVLRIVLPEINLDLRVDARTCWSRPGTGETWYLGCALKPKLPDQVLTDLAINGFLQRRRDPRRPTDLSAQMRCEGTAEVADVQICDFSPGGLRVRAPQPVEMGQRLLIQLPEGSGAAGHFIAKTTWQLRRDDGYELGCTFVNKEGLQLIHDALLEDRDAADEKARPPRRRSRGWWLAAALLLAALLAAYAWIS